MTTTRRRRSGARQEHEARGRASGRLRRHVVTLAAVAMAAGGAPAPAAAPGEAPPGPDHDAMVPATPVQLRSLERYFVPFGIEYGDRVDPGDALVLARRVGVAVGRVVDRGDVPRIHRVAQRHPVYVTARIARVGPVMLRRPSDRIELIGMHESSHDGARDLRPLRSGVRTVTMESRDRGTGPRTAADVVVAPGRVIRSPVSGRVIRAGSYVLYCHYRDEFLVIEPTAHPGWEVKVLHVTGLRVGVGDRLTAGRTVVAARPTPLPFRSQVDELSRPRNWPHVHIEVVDPSIKDRPGRGC